MWNPFPIYLCKHNHYASNLEIVVVWFAIKEEFLYYKENATIELVLYFYDSDKTMGAGICLSRIGGILERGLTESRSSDL